MKPTVEYSLVLLASSLLLPVVCPAAERAPEGLPRSQPEAQGVSSSGVLAFVDAADRQIDSLHSFMLVRHGYVVAEGWWSPYNSESPHELYSLSKSFTSTAVGLAVEEGKLSVDDEVLKFFPEDAPSEPSANLKAMRVSDLLRMSTGHQDEPPGFGGGMSVKAFLAQAVPHKPGTHFKYNTPATYMQSAIVQKVTGQRVVDFLRPRLFEPLGIQDPTWGTSAEGVTLGGYGLSVRTEDIARFGQLYLQKGQWQGRQLVPASWIEAATARQTSNGSSPKSDWDQGYGYQFWRCRNGAYRGDGAFGQYCIVMPEQDAVVAITGGVRDMQAVLNLVWAHLLPALQPRELPADRETRDRLKERLAHLHLPLVNGSATSPQAGNVFGRRFAFPANDEKWESLSMESRGDGGGVTLVTRMNGTDQRVVCGQDEWTRGRMALGTTPARPVAACGAWTSDDTYTARICLYETPFVRTLKLRFANDEVILDSEANVGFGATKPPQLVGRRE